MENKLISITARPVESSRVENEIISQVSTTEISSPGTTGSIQSSQVENQIVSQVSITETSSAVITSQVIESTGYNFNTDVSLTGYGEESIPSSGLFLRPDDSTHTVTPSERVSKLYAKSFNEQFTNSEQVRFLTNKVNTEIVNETDLITLVVGFNRVLTETADVDDLLAVLLQKPITDSSTVSELLTSNYGSNRLDTLAATDVLSSLVDFKRELIDSVTSTDDVLGLANIDDDQIASFGKVLVDSTTLSDILVPTAIFIRDFSDLSTSTDQAQLLLNKVNTELVNETDLITLLINQAFIETETVADVLAVSLQKPLTDNSTVSDSFTSNYASSRLEATTISDTSTLSFAQQLTDAVTTTDDVLGLANIDDDQIASFSKILDDSTTLSDILVPTAIFIRDFSDLSTSTEQAQLLLNKVNSELVNETDLITLLINQAFTETESATEILTVSLQKPLTDNSIVSDSFTSNYVSSRLDVFQASDTSTLSFAQQLTDAVTSTDDVLGLANIDDDQVASFSKILFDIISVIQETITLDITFGRNFVETVTNSETKIANIQNFFQSNFVQAGYVGTDLTL